VFACHWCERRFPSSARLNRHIKHQHVLHHEKNEARVRAQLEAAAANEEGFSLRDIRDLLGHANVGTTDTYLRGLGASSAVERAKTRT